MTKAREREDERRALEWFGPTLKWKHVIKLVHGRKVGARSRPAHLLGRPREANVTSYSHYWLGSVFKPGALSVTVA